MDIQIATLLGNCSGLHWKPRNIAKSVQTLRPTRGIAAALGSFRGHDTGLLYTIPALAETAAEVAAQESVVLAQQSRDLADALFGLHEAVNLVSFFCAEVLVNLATWSWWCK